MIWGEDWHEGVIGIVASRLVERFNRPGRADRRAATGEWKGSGRSMPAFDLHGALGACSEHLGRFGGHRAAAGLSIDPAASTRSPRHSPRTPTRGSATDDLAPVTRIDAIVPGSALTLGLAHGARTAGAVRARQPRRDPARPGLRGGAARRRRGGEAPSLPHPPGRPRRRLGDRVRPRRAARPATRGPVRYDLACRLKENRWNGTVAPQLVIRRLFDAPDGYEELRDEPRRALARGRGRVDARGARDLRRARARRRARVASSTSRRRSGRCSPDTALGELPRAA